MNICINNGLSLSSNKFGRIIFYNCDFKTSSTNNSRVDRTISFITILCNIKYKFRIDVIRVSVCAGSCTLYNNCIIRTCYCKRSNITNCGFKSLSNSSCSIIFRNINLNGSTNSTWVRCIGRSYIILSLLCS